MTYAYLPSPVRFVIPSAILLDAARCWRRARDTGQSVQPSLTAILRDHACEMLAPVFDSLLTLFEAALGRRLSAGTAADPSQDEHLLLGLLDGSAPRRTCLDCSLEAATTLDCAICSTRIMLAMTLVQPAAGNELMKRSVVYS